MSGIDELGMAIEPYARGFIIADYSGHRGEASYAGVRDEWFRMPVRIGIDTFSSAELAEQAARERSLGLPKR